MNGFEYLRRANYYETDMMGIVHHSNHIRYFEEARIAFMAAAGCDVRELELAGIIIPNVDAYARYKKPIRFSDDIIIRVRLKEFNGVKMEFEYEIALSASGETAALGHTAHCFVNPDFKPLNLRKKHPDVYKKLFSVLTADK